MAKAKTAKRACAWPKCGKDISARGGRAKYCEPHQRENRREQDRRRRAKGKDGAKRQANGDPSRWRDAVGAESTRVDAAPAPDAAMRHLPVSALHPSTSRAQALRRDRFDDEGLAELAQSIRSLGVIEPLLVRSWPGGDGWLIVAGERRWLAARQAGLDTVPCIVRQWNDDQAAVAQLVENLQRVDIHAFDEATGYGTLREAGWDAPRIAREVGRSKSHVYGRLRLLDLSPDCRDALHRGEVSATVGRSLSSVPAALQDEALAELARQREWNGGELTSRSAEEFIDSNYRRRIDGRPETIGFDPQDGALLAEWPDAGGALLTRAQACGGCEWNTTRNRSLGGATGLCCMPTCHAAKQRQTATKRAAAAARRGVEVVHATDEDLETATARPSSRRWIRTDSYDGIEAAAAAKGQGVDLTPVLLVVEDEERLARDGADRLVEVYRKKDIPKRPRPDDPWRRKRDKSRAEVEAVAGRLRPMFDRAAPPSPSQILTLLRFVTSEFLARAWSSTVTQVASRWEGAAEPAADLSDICPDDSTLARFACDLALAQAKDRENPTLAEECASRLETLERQEDIDAKYGFAPGTLSGVR